MQTDTTMFYWHSHVVPLCAVSTSFPSFLSRTITKRPNCLSIVPLRLISPFLSQTFLFFNSFTDDRMNPGRIYGCPCSVTQFSPIMHADIPLLFLPLRSRHVFLDDLILTALCVLIRTPCRNKILFHFFYCFHRVCPPVQYSGCMNKTHISFAQDYAVAC